jgi:hypothetical protein
MALSDTNVWFLPGTAQRLWFEIRNTTGGLVTGWTGADSEISKDGMAFADCTNEAVEIGTSGVGYIDLTSLECNVQRIVIYKLTVTNANATPVVIQFISYSSVLNQIATLTSAQVAADLENETSNWDSALPVLAGAVWNKDFASHNFAGTFGRLLNNIRKSKLSTEGTVTTAATPTSLVFTTSLTNATGAHDSKLLMFTSGALEGQSKPIDTYVSTSGRITLQEPLTAAPANGVEFVITPEHIHSMLDSAVTIRSVGVSVRATQADDGTVSLYNGRVYNGTAHPKLSFATSKSYTGATGLVLKFYDNESPTSIFASASASAVSSTLIEVPAFTATFTPTVVFDGVPAVFECRYALIANWAGSSETVATGPAFLYQNPTYA